MPSVSRRRVLLMALTALLWLETVSHAQETTEVSAHLFVPASPTKSHTAAPVGVAIWLTPAHGAARAAISPRGPYTLVQRNKQFLPHLLVVPIGSTVHFPNQDPYFHNVFSLFNGRRFDLGLYEAGATRDVNFPREGVSYIFCNIHPEMSAVVLSLATPYYGSEEDAAAQKPIRIHDVPAGTYTLHVWVEGETETILEALSRVVEISSGHTDLGVIRLPAPPHASGHTNKFDQPYDASHPTMY